MVSRGEKKYVIWPIYFDKTVSRLDGRKVSKKIAIEKPSIENIAKTAKALGLNPIIEKSAAHPSRPYKKDGRVLVDKKDKKSKIIARIAKQYE
jgi:signal recognition particle subunit SRP19